MLILDLGDWSFDVDIQSTMTYSSAEAAEHCECGYCRNFYASVDNIYPDFRRVFAQFGLDIEAPDSLFPIEATLYFAIYTVKGRIVRQGNAPILINGIPVLPQQMNDSDRIWDECFILAVGPFDLPWVLNEPMDEVISPANLPSFLKQMLETVLKFLPNTSIS